MEAAARRLCVAVLMEHSPAAAAAPASSAVHGEARVALPALPEFVALLQARGRDPQVRRVTAPAARYASFEEVLGFLRRQTWVAQGGPKDRKLVGDRTGARDRGGGPVAAAARAAHDRHRRAGSRG